MKRKMRKPMVYRTAEEAGKLLASHSSAPLWNETRPVPVKVERPVRHMISIRLEMRLYNRLRQVAADLGVPYQTLIQQWLSERARLEHGKHSDAVQVSARFALGQAAPGRAVHESA